MYLIVVTFFAPPKTRQKSYRFGGEGLGYIQTADEKNHEDKCMDYFCTAQKTHFLIMTYHKNQSPFHLRIWWDGGVGSVVGDHAMVMGERRASGEYVMPSKNWLTVPRQWHFFPRKTIFTHLENLRPISYWYKCDERGVNLTVKGLE